MKNLLHFTINIRKSHHQPQCTFQLVCQDRVLFVWVDRHVSLCRQQHPKCDRATSVYPPFLFFLSFFFLFSSLFIQPDKQTLNGVISGDSKSSISVTNQPLTQLHINLCSDDDRHYHLPKYWHFLLNHPVFYMKILPLSKTVHFAVVG